MQGWKGTATFLIADRIADHKTWTADPAPDYQYAAVATSVIRICRHFGRLPSVTEFIGRCIFIRDTQTIYPHFCCSMAMLARRHLRRCSFDGPPWYNCKKIGGQTIYVWRGRAHCGLSWASLGRLVQGMPEPYFSSCTFCAADYYSLCAGLYGVYLDLYVLLRFLHREAWAAYGAPWDVLYHRLWLRYFVPLAEHGERGARERALFLRRRHK
jgi:hypothetical protein